MLSSHHQLLELLQSHTPVSFEVRLLNHIPNVVVTHLCLPHLRQKVLQTLGRYHFVLLSLENCETFEEVLLFSDGQHHSN